MKNQTTTVRMNKNFRKPVLSRRRLQEKARLLRSEKLQVEKPKDSTPMSDKLIEISFPFSDSTDLHRAWNRIKTDLGGVGYDHDASWENLEKNVIKSKTSSQSVKAQFSASTALSNIGKNSTQSTVGGEWGRELAAPSIYISHDYDDDNADEDFMFGGGFGGDKLKSKLGEYDFTLDDNNDAGIREDKENSDILMDSKNAKTSLTFAKESRY